MTKLRTVVHSLLLGTMMLASGSCLVAQETPVPEEPTIAKASDEGQQALGGFEWRKDELTARLFAAEPMIANPVALHIDFQGRVYVCETFRQAKGVEDNRKHADWLDEDLAAQTVQDRIDYIKKYIEDADESYTRYDDRIRLLKDEDGDGKADFQTVFADRFNAIEMGTGAGVLSYNGSVYYTCIPDVFLLKDKDNDGVADSRDSLQTGFGVRFAFRGHDMHGLIVGPDGRLYFSIGDRGYNLQTPNGVLKDPASGAVFRCELDGSNLEVIATGLRNPQELAFDDYGNLFTGDNNSDSGDKARWVYIVPGSDSGWRMYYQYMEDRGPFNQERIWYPYNEDSPAYIVPPVENISDGPSGLAYYPGTGFSDFFKDRFFLCDFRGTADDSGIRTFRSKRKGAFWEVVDMDETFWQMLATDMDFGPDGKIYVADWVFGWVGENKGRIYTFEDESRAEERAQVAAILKDFPSSDADRMLELLSHPDRRVRQESQFGLARLPDAARRFVSVRSMTKETLPRVHSIWGLGQLQRASGGPLQGSVLETIKAYLTDEVVEVRAAAALLAGESKTFELEPAIREMLDDGNERVRYHAELAMSFIGNADALPRLANTIEKNTDDDPIVRHGGIMALIGILGRTPSDQLESVILSWLERDDARSRLALVIALRKMHQPDSLLNRITREKAAEIASRISLAQALGDKENSIVLEAARAIHDLPVPDAMPALAAMLADESVAELADPVIRRVLNAAFRIGGNENAMNIAAFAANKDAFVERRIDALKMLSTWAEPPSRDWLLGDWRPLEPREAAPAYAGLARHFAAISTDQQSEIKNEAITAAGKLNLKEAATSLAAVVKDRSMDVDTRCAALVSLGDMKYEDLGALLATLKPELVEGKSPKFAGTMCKVAATIDEATAMDLIMPAVDTPPTADNFELYQMAISALGDVDGDRSFQLLRENLSAVTTLPPTVRLDVVDAAERSGGDLAAMIEKLRSEMTDPEDATALYNFTLEGGNAEAGERIFSGKTEVSCIRCHVIDGTGGEVGPNLSEIALTKDRQYLLESIVVPNKMIAEGFAQQIILTEDGETLTGIVTEEVDGKLRLVDADGEVTWVPVDSIEGRKQGKSSMPEDLIEQLTQAEVRDLIEYLSQQNRDDAAGSEEHGEGE